MVLSGHRSRPLAGSAREGPCLRFTFEETKVRITLGALLVRGLQGQAPGCSEGRLTLVPQGLRPPRKAVERENRSGLHRLLPVGGGGSWQREPRTAAREPASGRPGAPRTRVSEANARPRGLTGVFVPELQSELETVFHAKSVAFLEPSDGCWRPWGCWDWVPYLLQLPQG